MTVSLIVCIKRNPDMTHAEFTEHWRAHHGPLFRDCPDFTRHLLSYSQHHPLEADSPLASMFGSSHDFDGVARLTFASKEKMERAFAEPVYLERVKPDEATFVDAANCLSFVTRDVPVLETDLFSVHGKTAVVTGGAKGIGAMITRALMEAGVRVLIVSRDTEGNRRFAEEMNAIGECSLLAYDLSSVVEIDEAVAAIAEATKELHILINNAGTFTAAPLDELGLDAWDRELAINLRAPFRLSQALLPQLMAASREGDPARIVNIGSIAALWAKSSSAYAYGASKAGVHQLTRMLASDLTAQGINVNAVAPGFFPSDMTDSFFETVPGLKEQMIAGIPADRLGTPEDIGGAVLFLCSRAGAYCSGAILPVEGALWSA